MANITITKKISKLLKDRSFWYIVALTSIVAIVSYPLENYLLIGLPSEMEKHDTELLLQSLQIGLALSAVAIAAWQYKFRGGLVAVIAIGLVLLPHTITTISNALGIGHLSVYAIGMVSGIGLSRVISNRKSAEETINHLNSLLKTIRRVNRLITQEKDVLKLIQESCNLLAETKDGYEIALILLLDKKRNFVAVASAGFGENTPAFRKQLETGHYPECIKELLSQEQPFLFYDQPGELHDECVLAIDHINQGISVSKIEHEGRLYGVLGVTAPLSLSFYKEEQNLFLELNSDIGFAIANIERQAEIARFKTISDVASYGMCMVDSERRITYANKACSLMHAYKREELIGQHYTVLVPESQTETVNTLFDISEKTGSFTDKEIVHKRKDGTTFPALMSAATVSDADGRRLYSSIIIVDITERKRAQEQIITQDRLATIGQLVAGVAHEINNPLTTVIGFSDLLLRRELPDDIKADVKIVHDEGQRAAKITRNLLTFSRQQHEGKNNIQVNECLKLVLSLRAHPQKINNIAVNTRFAEGLPFIYGNASELQQVFLNLVINAEQAMLEAHGKGTIDITTEQTSNIIKISFADDGPGIKPENMRKLFTPFFTTKEVGKGTGLGLSISYGIITQHGGKIYAESESGKGATFIIELPVT